MNSKYFEPLVVGILLAMIAIPGQLTAQCAAAHPQKVHVLFDNSESLSDSLRNYTHAVDDWFQRLFSALRPGDSLYVHPLVNPGEDTVRTLERLQIPVGPSRLGGADARRIRQRLSSGPRSDLSESMRKLREALPLRHSVCPRMLLVVTDAMLAPNRPGFTRDAAARALHREVTLWRADGAFVLAVLASPRLARAFDPEYSWIDSDDASTDRREIYGPELLTRAFGTWVRWDNPDALAQHLYYSAGSHLGSMWSDSSAQAPALSGMNANYLLYRVDAPSAAGGEYDSCSHERVADHLRHYITSTSPTYDWCYHHLIKPPIDLSLRTVRSARGFVWAAQPQLDMSALPNPLLSAGQIRISDLEEAKSQPGCASPLAQRHFAEGGWLPGRPSKILQLTIANADSPQDVVSLNLHQIPGTACYAQLQASSSLDTLPDAQRVHVTAFVEGENNRRATTSRERSAGAPRWAQVQARHIVSWKPFRASVWLVSGKLVLPRSQHWQEVMVGSKTVALDSVDAGDCEKVRRGDKCFSFTAVYGSEPPARAFLLASDNDPDPVPMDLDAPWNSLSFAMPWEWAAALLLSAFAIAMTYFKRRHRTLVATAVSQGKNRGRKEFWLDVQYYGFFWFFIAFMLAEALVLWIRFGGNSATVAGGAFVTALTSIFATQFLRLFSRSSSREER